jgi:hypothetical protein
MMIPMLREADADRALRVELDAIAALESGRAGRIPERWHKDPKCMKYSGRAMPR